MKIFPIYYQFGIWDTQNPNSYPLPSGKETDFVKGKNGLTILLQREKDIELTISDTPNENLPYLLIETEIEVGSQGVSCGNVVSSTIDSYNYNLRPGVHILKLFGNSAKLGECTKFHCVLIVKK